MSERDLDLGLIAGLQLYGWIFGHSAVIHPDPAERAGLTMSSGGGCRACAPRSSAQARRRDARSGAPRPRRPARRGGRRARPARCWSRCGGHRVRDRPQDAAPRPPDPGRLPGALRPRDGRRARRHRRARARGRLRGLRRLRPVPRRARGDLPRADLGAGRLRRAHRGAAGALHPIPDGLDFAGAAMAEPLAACVHAMGARHRRGGRRRARRRDDRAHARAPARARRARRPRLRPPPRAPRAGARRSARGRRTRSASTTSSSRRSAAPRRGSRRSPPRAPGGTVVLVGGCPGGTTVRARDRAAALRRGRRARRLSPHARRGRPRAGAAGRRRRRLARARGATSSASRTWRARCRRRPPARRASSWWIRRDEARPGALALCAPRVGARRARAACPAAARAAVRPRARERRARSTPTSAPCARASPVISTGVAGLSVAGPSAALRGRLRPAPRIACAPPWSRLRAVRAGRAQQRRATRRRSCGWPARCTATSPAGADADLRLLRDLARLCHDPLLRRVVVVVLADQNPDGRGVRTRVNVNGFDLNRDWLALTQPETQARLRRAAGDAAAGLRRPARAGRRRLLRPALRGAAVPRAAARRPSAAERDVLGPAMRSAFARKGYPSSSDGTLRPALPRLRRQRHDAALRRGRA